MKWLALACMSVFLLGSIVYDTSEQDYYVLDDRIILIGCKDWEKIERKLVATTDYWDRQARKCPLDVPSCMVEHMMFDYSLDKLRIVRKKLHDIQVGDGKGKFIPNHCPEA